VIRGDPRVIRGDSQVIRGDPAARGLPYVTWFTAARPTWPPRRRLLVSAGSAARNPVVSALPISDGGTGRFNDGTPEARKFTYFLPFGLTSS